MNKTLIIVLAICLISVHGFVKRDAPVTQSSLGDIQKQISELSDTFSKQFQDAINPHVLKDKVSEILKKASEAIKDLDIKPDAPKA